MKHVSKNLSDTLMFTLQEKCVNFVGNKIVEQEFDNLMKERERIFVSYFKENSTSKQLAIRAATIAIPYNGFSYFQLRYPSGTLPSLQRAYEKMMELDNECARKRYKKYRESNLPKK